MLCQSQRNQRDSRDGSRRSIPFLKTFGTAALALAAAAACGEDPTRPDAALKASAWTAEECVQTVEQQVTLSSGEVHAWSVCESDTGMDETEDGDGGDDGEAR